MHIGIEMRNKTKFYLAEAVHHEWVWQQNERKWDPVPKKPN